MSCPVKPLPEIKINGSNLFGGAYITGASINIDKSGGQSSISIDLFNETGKYFFPDGLTDVQISIGEKNFRMIYSGNSTQNSGTTTARVNFVDQSYKYLDIPYIYTSDFKPSDDSFSFPMSHGNIDQIYFLGAPVKTTCGGSGAQFDSVGYKELNGSYKKGIPGGIGSNNIIRSAPGLSSDIIYKYKVNALFSLLRRICPMDSSFSKLTSRYSRSSAWFSEVGSVRSLLSSFCSKAGLSFYWDFFTSKVSFVDNSTIKLNNSLIKDRKQGLEALDCVISVSYEEDFSAAEAVGYALEGDRQTDENNCKKDNNTVGGNEYEFSPKMRFSRVPLLDHYLRGCSPKFIALSFLRHKGLISSSAAFFQLFGGGNRSVPSYLNTNVSVSNEYYLDIRAKRLVNYVRSQMGFNGAAPTQQVISIVSSPEDRKKIDASMLNIGEALSLLVSNQFYVRGVSNRFFLKYNWEPKDETVDFSLSWFKENEFVNQTPFSDVASFWGFSGSIKEYLKFIFSSVAQQDPVDPGRDIPKATLTDYEDKRTSINEDYLGYGYALSSSQSGIQSLEQELTGQDDQEAALYEMRSEFSSSGRLFVESKIREGGIEKMREDRSAFVILESEQAYRNKIDNLADEINDIIKSLKGIDDLTTRGTLREGGGGGGGGSGQSPTNSYHNNRNDYSNYRKKLLYSPLDKKCMKRNIINQPIDSHDFVKEKDLLMPFGDVMNEKRVNLSAEYVGFFFDQLASNLSYKYSYVNKSFITSINFSTQDYNIPDVSYLKSFGTGATFVTTVANAPRTNNNKINGRNIYTR